MISEFLGSLTFLVWSERLISVAPKFLGADITFGVWTVMTGVSSSFQLIPPAPMQSNYDAPNAPGSMHRYLPEHPSA